ncbi:MAG: GNAT family N-acetyltransferase [Bacteroidetes bacterium B1(2017)]|nr:MAG: GNAT family N-acetyltransferase [Bacteroidetes bacterium B1(2017)]
MKVNYRKIKESDNLILASIIKGSIESMALPLEGTAHSDPTTNDLFAYFSKDGSSYLVAEQDGIVLGGCGIYPSNGLPEKHAELVRFFLHESARGKGIGKHLMEACEQLALSLNYTHLYLESFPDMKAAIHLYEKFGYQKLDAALGNTGHFSCNVWMLKRLCE